MPLTRPELPQFIQSFLVDDGGNAASKLGISWAGGDISAITLQTKKLRMRIDTQRVAAASVPIGLWVVASLSARKL